MSSWLLNWIHRSVVGSACLGRARRALHVCELNQKGIESGGYRPGPYFPRESLLVAFDEEYRRHMEQEST